MGTATTSASYRRTQNPLVTKFFYGITGIQRNWQRTLVTNPSFQTQFFYHLINASRNIFLDALVAAFINGTWPLINSTYRFPFPSFFDVFAALNVSMISFMRALKINPSVYFSMVRQSSLFSLQLRGKVIPLPSSLSFLQD